MPHPPQASPSQAEVMRQEPQPRPDPAEIYRLGELTLAVVRAATRLVDLTADGGTAHQSVDPEAWVALSAAVSGLGSAVPASEQPAAPSHGAALVLSALEDTVRGPQTQSVQDEFGAHITGGVLGWIGDRAVGPGDVVLSGERYGLLLDAYRRGAAGIWCASVAINMMETIELYIAADVEPTYEVVLGVWQIEYPHRLLRPQGWQGPLEDSYPYIDQVFRVKIHTPGAPAPSAPVVGDTPNPGTGRELYIFFRRDNAGELYFYPVEVVPGTLDEHIEKNPGTVRVEDPSGRLMWREPNS